MHAGKARAQTGGYGGSNIMVLGSNQVGGSGSSACSQLLLALRLSEQTKAGRHRSSRNLG